MVDVLKLAAEKPSNGEYIGQMSAGVSSELWPGAVDDAVTQNRILVA